jgi:hypothetical protein
MRLARLLLQLAALVACCGSVAGEATQEHVPTRSTEDYIDELSKCAGVETISLRQIVRIGTMMLNSAWLTIRSTKGTVLRSGQGWGSASMQSSEKLRLNSFSAQCLWTRARKPPVRDWLQLSISFPSSSSSAPRSGSSTYTRQPLKGKGRASQRTIRFRGDAVCLCPAVAGGVAGAIVGTIVVTKFPCVRLAFREQHGNADDYCRPSHFTPP